MCGCPLKRANAEPIEHVNFDDGSPELPLVSLVLLVEFRVDLHHLCICAGLDLVPWLRVSMSVPDDMWTTGKSGEVPAASSDRDSDDDDDRDSLWGVPVLLE